MKTVKNRGLILMTGVVILIVALSVLIGQWINDTAALISANVLLVFVILFVLRQTHCKTQKSLNDLSFEIKNNYVQTEAHFSILSIIKPVAPLPQSRGWAGSPDFLKIVTDIIFKERPKTILELGSGISTLIAAYSLKRAEIKGRVLSFDHQESYAAATNENLKTHGLETIAKAFYAPLTDVAVNGEMWRWYDLKQFHIDSPIDLLIIDGPPGILQKNARYPALPLLFKHLSERAVIILDDAARVDEQEIAKLWADELSSMTYEFLPLEKGALIVRKK